jgi:hypothetical protein
MTGEGSKPSSDQPRPAWARTPPSDTQVRSSLRAEAVAFISACGAG